MSFKQIHEDNRREKKLQDAEAAGTGDQRRHLEALRKKESDIQNEMTKVQPLGDLSQLNDQLQAVREEIERLQNRPS
jgi:hypothetical protein